MERERKRSIVFITAMVLAPVIGLGLDKSIAGTPFFGAGFVTAMLIDTVVLWWFARGAL